MSAEGEEPYRSVTLVLSGRNVLAGTSGIGGLEALNAAKLKYRIQHRFSHTHFSQHPLSYHRHSEQPPAEANDGGEAPPGGLTDADIDSNWDEAIDTFDGMEIPEELLRGIYAYGFEKPSAIQQRAIKPTMLGRDLIAQAQSGTVSRNECCAIFIIDAGVMGVVSRVEGGRRGMTIVKNTIFRVRTESPSSCG
eukprot:scaffold5804_cov117-Skeletonema_dohrnii-CCMP3373.AAC.1